MVTAHAKMREMKPITEAAFHALVVQLPSQLWCCDEGVMHVWNQYDHVPLFLVHTLLLTAMTVFAQFHVMAMMKKHNSGGEQEMDEVHPSHLPSCSGASMTRA